MQNGIVRKWHGPQLLNLSAACLVLPVALGCATAHLDPERNQALTFDAVDSPDAGAPSPIARGNPIKSSPSQLGSTDNKGATPIADAGPIAEPITCTVDPPDPKPIHTREWLAYEFSFKEGVVDITSLRREQTAKPRDTSRRVGRYAIELWIGCELIDRVRFSFPLQAAEQPQVRGARHGLNEQPSLTANAHLTSVALVPLDLRATRAELVDRGTGKRSSLAWPPNLPAVSSVSTQQSPTVPARTAPASGSQQHR